MTNVEMITNTAALESAVERFSGEPLLAFDLEADSMHHYREQVCLIQISVPDANYVIDPLACRDLSPLVPIFNDPKIRKVFHGADYDVRSLHRDFGIEIFNLFDTMIACQFLGEQEVGLAAVLKKRYGVELDKRFQQADWSRRPISSEMIDYAVKDTSLLIPLYRELEKELQGKGRLEWVLEECRILTGVRTAERSEGPLFLRFKGAGKMSPPTLAVLEELLKFREKEAERRDVPPFKVLGSDTLRELAERKPLDTVEMMGIPGLSPRLLDRYSQELAKVVVKGMSVTPDCLPRYPTVPRQKRLPIHESRLKRLKAWREKKAEIMGLSPGLLANNALLESFAESDSTVEVSSLLKEWQRIAIGDELKAMLAGNR